MISFNVNDGYAEAMVRGMRKGCLGESQYNLLKSVNSLKEFISILGETDYCDYIINSRIENTTELKIELKEKLGKEVNYLQANCGEDCQKFIQIIKHKYMLDNVITVVEGKKNKTSSEVIKARLEPLGYLKEITKLADLEIDKVEDLYEQILIDTEVGYYFSKLFESAIIASENKSMVAIENYLRELTVENLKNYLKKIWLEHFYDFTRTCNGTTRQMMEEILFIEADFQAIQIVYNLLRGEFNKDQKEEREKLLPSFGYLYPAITTELYTCASFEQLKQLVQFSIK